MLFRSGVPIRLTGQDTERGTFSQRHLVLHDLRTGVESTPLDRVGAARFEIYNSPLTETAALGFEYGYSVMERLRLAALQGDAMTQQPMIVTPGFEAWKTKEAKTTDAPTLGDAQKRGVLLEAVTAVMLLLAGADVLVMRHPEAIKLVREMIADFTAK